MKELSIGQKAKAYDEALERAIKHRDNDGLTLEQYETIDIIFPELKESEGELKWLTKYIEEEAYSLSMDIRDNEDRIKLKKLQKSLAWLEKHAEKQTLTEWSKEDERERKRIIGLLEGWMLTFKETYYAEECKYGIDWLKSLHFI